MNLPGHRGLAVLSLVVVPLILAALLLFHPAAFTIFPGVSAFLSHPQTGDPHFNAIAYFGPDWWFVLHMIQTPLIVIVSFGLLWLTGPIGGFEGARYTWLAWISRIATVVFMTYYTVLDGIGGIGLGRQLSVINTQLAAGALTTARAEAIRDFLDAMWIDPWVGGMGSFVSLTGSWAVFVAAVSVAAYLLLNRRASWLVCLLLVGFGWELQVTHASYHGPVAFSLLALASALFLTRPHAPGQRQPQAWAGIVSPPQSRPHNVNPILHRSFGIGCLVVAPLLLAAIELFHPAHFTAAPGMSAFLSHPQSGDPHFKAIAYFGPHWWFVLHMMQTPLVVIVSFGLLWLTGSFGGLASGRYIAVAWISRIATVVFMTYYTVLDGIGGIALGRQLQVLKDERAAGALTEPRAEAIREFLDAMWIDPWVGGVGSFISLIGSWAVFVAAAAAAAYLLLNRRTSWLVGVLLIAFGWELQVAHASHHGPVAFSLLALAAALHLTRRGAPPRS